MPISPSLIEVIQMPEQSTAEPVSPDDLTRTLSRIRSEWTWKPDVALILGTGLGNFVTAIEQEVQFSYADLPGFPRTTAIGHAGRMICGTINGVRVLILQGRCHLYEGYALAEVTFPIKVVSRLGARTLIVSCAAGGLGANLEVGDLMVIEDHLNLQFPPYRAGFGLSDRERRGEAYYDLPYQRTLEHIARRSNIPLTRGVYAAVTGPNYETRSELRFLRTFAHAIGMSTVPEVTAAHRLGIRVCGIATITNICRPDQASPADGHHVIAMAERAEPRFRTLVTKFLSTIRESM